MQYIDTAEAVATFAAEIASAPSIALDTEGASFHRFVDRVYLMQLSTRTATAIVDPLPTGDLSPLRPLVESPDIEIVFHDADYDLRLLRQDYGWATRNIFDTRIAAQLLGYKAFGLAALLELHFGIGLDKKFQRADWSLRPLSDGMLQYASQDTMYLLALRDILHGELKAKDRLGWAAEEFTRLEQTQWTAEDSSQLFLKVKGARDLKRRELAVLRELVPWRDGVAKELDRSTFRVVSNEVLLEICRVQPTSKQALGVIKGMPRGVLDQRGDVVLACVARAMALDEADLPRFPKAPRWEKDPEFDDRAARLRAVRDEVAASLELDPGVLCSREKLDAIARRLPTTIAELYETPDLRRWQADLLGPGVLKALKATGAPAPAAKPAAATVAAPASSSDDSPYRD
ncbi:MAG TPA: HRDC domain-containing protein [Gemmatimonadaceae bacterium]|nr:HRDC domain-containing protein [Gemmatimonadaceae bacterium]